MPNKKYLVGDSDIGFQEQEFRIVNASSQRQAIEKYVRQVAIEDQVFLDYVYLDFGQFCIIVNLRLFS